MTQDAAIPLVAVVGPTASGKSALAVALAERFAGEVVSADALAVYREMNIGTAKPGPEDLARAPHHCVDCIDPADTCDAQRWVGMAEAAIQDIHRRGRLPILAGGTPLYFKLLLEGISAGPPGDPAIRDALQARYDSEGGEALLAELRTVDPDYAAQRHPNDARRIIRALEVHRIAGRPFSSFHVTDGIRRECYRTCLIGLQWDKEHLHRRINARAKAMFANGLVEEVERLRPRLSKQAADGVGYKEVLGYLDGAYDRDHAQYLVQRATRSLAKRQRTWYRRFPDIHWLPGEDPTLVDRASGIVKAFNGGAIDL